MISYVQLSRLIFFKKEIYMVQNWTCKQRNDGGYAVSTEDTININITGENKCKATMH